MFAVSFSRLRGRRFAGRFAPRKPRHRLLRVALTLCGVALLAVLLVFGLAIGAAMVGAGLLFKLWRHRRKPMAKDAKTLDGEYRVLRKPALTAGR